MQHDPLKNNIKLRQIERNTNRLLFGMTATVVKCGSISLYITSHPKLKSESGFKSDVLTVIILVYTTYAGFNVPGIPGYKVSRGGDGVACTGGSVPWPWR